MRRTELGKSQADVAFDSEQLTQTTVSELERGKYGPEDLTAFRLAALAKGLNWTIPELETATGLNLGLYVSAPETLDIVRNEAGEVIGAAFRSSPSSRPMPEGLQEAIDEYGDEIKAFRDPAIVAQLRGARHLDGGPRTAEDWREYYLDMRRWLHRK